MVRISVCFTGSVSCPHCGSGALRKKDRRLRRLRHESWGTRHTEVHLETGKFRCLGCLRYFWQRFPGILPRQRSSERFHRAICEKHFDGISRSRLSKRERISSATIQRWFTAYLSRLALEKTSTEFPQLLGIDEHFFSRRKGYATTFCDLKNHKVYDVVLGRSELSLESYLGKLKGKDRVKVVCMDLSTGYRSLVKKHFPQATIVADRFHVIRVVNHHFLACWKQIDPVGSKNRGLLSLMRRHRHNLNPEQHTRLLRYLAANPAMEPIYRFKQRLCYLLLEKHHTKRKCLKLAARLLRSIAELQDAVFSSLVQLGATLHIWREEIAAMWRFTKNNGITEGFHTKMEVIQRQAYGLQNFENYRNRVKVSCS